MGKKALVLGGGAPNLTLMSGALLAMEQAGVTFDVITMAGAGTVVGLVYLAPKYLPRQEALADTINFGVSDLIYSMWPINYKIFSKAGPSADEFRAYWMSLPAVQAATYQYNLTEAQKLEADWLLFEGAVLCPTDVSYFSGGMCAHAPFIENIVDFDKLKAATEDCYVNAYCIEDAATVSFPKSQVDLRHFRAALSFPFIYPPYMIDGKHYFEGAAVEPLNLADLVTDHGVDRVVLFDVLTKELIHRPRNLWDAYAQSIILPLVANADKELDIFLHWVQTGYWVHEVNPKIPPPPPIKPNVTPFVVEFDVPLEQRPFMLDWSRSNLQRLFDIGYQAGTKFCQQHGAQLIP